jgi:arylsulfatase
MDREIGRIIAQLKTMGALENTVVFFLSDNGASAEMMVRGDGHNPDLPAGSPGTFLSLGPGWSSLANTPFRRHKTWVHEGGVSTSFIAHWPKGIAARGELRQAPAHLVDLVPTILQLAGGSPTPVATSSAPPLRGKSLVPVFSQDLKSNRETIWFLHEGNRALRAGDWKIVAAGDSAPWELYNVAHDRSESHNLAQQNPAKLRELVDQWTRETAEYQKWAEKDAPPEQPAKGKKKAGKA